MAAAKATTAPNIHPARKDAAQLALALQHYWEAAVLDSGHGYGGAKYDSRCPFTGARISHGQTIRRLTIMNADGSICTGYTSNWIYSQLGFTFQNVSQMGDPAHYNTPHDMCEVSPMRPALMWDWRAACLDALTSGSALPGTTIHLVKQCGIRHRFTLCDDGRWVDQESYAQKPMTAKQAAARFRRFKALACGITLPYQQKRTVYVAHHDGDQVTWQKAS